MGWCLGLCTGLWLMSFGLCLDERGPVLDSSYWSSRRNWFPGSQSQVGVASSGPWVSSEGRSRALPALQPVRVQCQSDNMVVTVQRDLFGTGRLVQPGDLRLGSAFCSYTSLNADNTVTFDSALHDCGNTRQVTQEFVIYGSILTYAPTTSGSTVITRTNKVSVLIQCVYPRHANVSGKAIAPTWNPLRTTVFAEAVISFSLRLMTDDWTSARGSTTFQLGDVFHLEASVDAMNHYPLRILVDSCVAAPTTDPDSRLQYDIISSYGCLVDGKLSGSSAFVSPRVQPEKLRFTVDAFRFIGTTNSLIFITCSLRAVPADSAPSPLSKACSYQASSGWSPMEGPPSICSCCDSGSCASSGGSRTLHHLPASRRHGKRGEPTFESRALAVGPLVVLSENDAAGADVPPLDILGLSDGEPRSMLGLQPEFLAPEMDQEGEHHRREESATDFGMEGNGSPEVVDWDAGLDELPLVDQRLEGDITLLETGQGEEELVSRLREGDVQGSQLLDSQAEDLEHKLPENSQVHATGPETKSRGTQLSLTPLELVEKFGVHKNWSKDSHDVPQEHRAQPGTLQDQTVAHLEGRPPVHVAQLGPLEVLDLPATDPEVHTAQLGPLQVLDPPETEPEVHIAQLGPLQVQVPPETEPEVHIAQLGPLQVQVPPETEPEVHIAQLGPLQVLDPPETEPEVHIAQLGPLQVQVPPETDPKVHIAQLGPLQVRDPPETEPEVHIAQLGPLQVLGLPETDPKVHIAQLGPLLVQVPPETDPEVHIAQLGPLQVQVPPETDPKVHIAQLGPLQVRDPPETEPEV
ncbi:uncharacterized protein LOC144799320 [Lissotriton helveticus]